MGLFSLFVGAHGDGRASRTHRIASFDIVVQAPSLQDDRQGN